MLRAEPVPRSSKGERTMCMTVGCARSLAISATFALAIFIASTASHAAETSEAFIVPLFPQKEADLKKGLPPG
jgi:hypothetical protein